jgi:histidine triad (HIT) family protein
MEETIFSKIISKEIPADIVYEDAEVLAFLDISPVTKGHTLVIPKKWSRNVLDIDSESWGHVMEVVRKLAPVIKEGMGADGINIVMNNEPAGNQAVFHSHVHIFPSFEGKKAMNWPEGTTYTDGESKEVAEKIKALIK